MHWIACMHINSGGIEYFKTETTGTAFVTKQRGWSKLMDPLQF